MSKCSVRRPLSLLLVFAVLGTSGLNVARAETPPKTPDEKKLEKEMERKEEEIGVFLAERRYRKIIKAHSFEFAPFIGPFLGDALPNSIVYGARTNYHVNERFAVGVDGGFTEAGFDPFTLGTVINNGDKDAYFIVGNVTYHIPNIILPIPEIYLSEQTIPVGGKIIQSDLFVTAGAGVFHSLGNDEPTINIGGGAKIYFSRFFVLRIDVRNFLVQAKPPVVPSSKLTANAVIMIGVSFFLPTQTPASKGLNRPLEELTPLLVPES